MYRNWGNCVLSKRSRMLLLVWATLLSMQVPTFQHPTEIQDVGFPFQLIVLPPLLGAVPFQSLCWHTHTLICTWAIVTWSHWGGHVFGNGGELRRWHLYISHTRMYLYAFVLFCHFVFVCHCLVIANDEDHSGWRGTSNDSVKPLIHCFITGQTGSHEGLPRNSTHYELHLVRPSMFGEA